MNFVKTILFAAIMPTILFAAFSFPVVKANTRQPAVIEKTGKSLEVPSTSLKANVLRYLIAVKA